MNLFGQSSRNVCRLRSSWFTAILSAWNARFITASFSVLAEDGKAFVIASLSWPVVKRRVPCLARMMASARLLANLSSPKRLKIYASSSWLALLTMSEADAKLGFGEVSNLMSSELSLQ